jgi:hypothetical protein
MHRGDSDAGGAADLQTDVMRFMAILALCLMAIFALVQSIPLIPEAPAESTESAAPPPIPIAAQTEPQAVESSPEETLEPVPEPPVQLTRAKWKSSFVPRQRPIPPKAVQPPESDASAAQSHTAIRPLTPAPRPDSPAEPEKHGFTLRFESDHALTRLVAAGKVNLYAIEDGRSRRMTVSDSRISFWDASTPATFHEMETATVPRPVVEALARSGVSTAGIGWGVTLPGKLRQQLDTLMRQHQGGALVIGLDGNLRLEPT